MNRAGERTLGPLHPEQLADIVNFASLLLRNDRYEEAITDFAETYRVFALIFGPDDKRVRDAAESLAEIHEEQGDPAEARQAVLEKQAGG